MKLVLPFPPSVNTYWRAPNKGPLAGHHLISAVGRKYQSAACVAIIEQLRRLPKPSTELAAVEIILYPPDKRIRDLDNYNKALFDALTHAGVWEDDSQVKRMLVEWGPVFPKGKVEITITKL
ncbi:RusA family crossover junction endodeoxyribonuclease, partial [Salmonella enterica]|nr:RusA family crossover junction endodeoxyribonuclease [Salmonella enterica]EKO1976846.1 RusA family crossover junction endodeoxyribonuclease [Salmonella enterica]